MAGEVAAQQPMPYQPSQRQELPAVRDPQPVPDRLANIKARLRLSTEQEKLWGPVEDAVRNLQARTRDLRSFSWLEVDQDIQLSVFVAWASCLLNVRTRSKGLRI